MYTYIYLTCFLIWGPLCSCLALWRDHWHRQAVPRWWVVATDGIMFVPWPLGTGWVWGMACMPMGSQSITEMKWNILHMVCLLNQNHWAWFNLYSSASWGFILLNGTARVSCFLGTYPKLSPRTCWIPVTSVAFFMVFSPKKRFTTTSCCFPRDQRCMCLGSFFKLYVR